MSGRKSRRTLWVAVCLGSVLTAGVLPAASAGAAPAPAPPELVKGTAVPYRVVVVPLPSPEPEVSRGVDVSEAGTLLMNTQPVKRIVSFGPSSPPRDGTGVALSHPVRGAIALSLNPKKCLEWDSTPLFWEGIRIAHDGVVTGRVECTDGEASWSYMQALVRWPAPTKDPEIIFETYPKWRELESAVGNREGAVLSTTYPDNLWEEPYPWRGMESFVTGGGTQERSLRGPNPHEYLRGTSLGGEGTVVGVLLRYRGDKAQRIPFVAPGGSPQAMDLSLPPRVVMPTLPDRPVIPLVSPDGDWVLARVGPHLVSWDAAWKPSILSSTADVAPIYIADGGRALMRTPSGPSILKGKTLSPLQVTGLPAGASLREVTRMNAAGQISATVKLPNDRDRAVLLEPVR